MSRIGRLPIAIPAGVTVSNDNNLITVKGALGTLTQVVDKAITVKVNGNVANVSRSSEEKEIKAMHGMYRKVIANMVEGVTKGYSKTLVINGVGFKTAKQGNKIVLNIGHSHPHEIVEPDGIKFEVPTTTEIVVKGIDKVAVGQCAANIKALRKPDPYHAYGIRLKEEVIARKEGKKAGK